MTSRKGIIQRGVGSAGVLRTVLTLVAGVPLWLAVPPFPCFAFFFDISNYWPGKLLNSFAFSARTMLYVMTVYEIM
jgi:hypothetical protein